MKTAVEYLEDNCSKSEFGLRIYKNSELEKAIKQSQLDILKEMEDGCNQKVYLGLLAFVTDKNSKVQQIITDCANTIRQKIKGGGK